MITGTFTNVDEVQSYRPWALVVAHNGRATTCPGRNELQLWDLDLFPRIRTNLLDLRNKDIQHRIKRLQLGNLCRLLYETKKNVICRHDRVVDDLDMQHDGNIYHFVDELRKHHPLLIGDCGNLSGMITETLPVPSILYTALGWRCTPVGGPTGCERSPLSTSRPP